MLLDNMNTTQTPNTEKIGVELSQNLKWDGFAIMEVTIAALTDSNFHKEAAIINEMLKKLEADPMRNEN